VSCIILSTELACSRHAEYPPSIEAKNNHISRNHSATTETFDASATPLLTHHATPDTTATIDTGDDYYHATPATSKTIDPYHKSL
jgi:hypothetical protein